LSRRADARLRTIVEVRNALAATIAGGLVCAGVVAATAASSNPPLVPTPIGVGPGYRLAPTSAAVRASRPVGSLTCSATSPMRFRAHLELFARKRVLIVPAGIGVAPPLRRDGAVVVRGKCLYQLRTREPTGVVEVAGARRLTVGDLFRVWGQPLGPHRIAGFTGSGPVLVFVNGRRLTVDPRTVPLRRHDEIVLEIGGYIPAHRSYLFPKGSS
jgi:hypothetical protein